MIEPETHRFKDDDGGFPNSPLPLLVYRGAVVGDAAAIEAIFARNDWRHAWRNGIYTYHHFHSTTHEVLGFVRGEVQVAFGGPAGQVLRVRAGDVVVIPAGVGHCNVGQSDDLLLVGAYPGGADWDVRRGDAAERADVLRNIAAVKLPRRDPIAGPDGPLLGLWR